MLIRILLIIQYWHIQIAHKHVHRRTLAGDEPPGIAIMIITTVITLLLRHHYSASANDNNYYDYELNNDNNWIMTTVEYLSLCYFITVLFCIFYLYLCLFVCFYDSSWICRLFYVKLNSLWTVELNSCSFICLLFMLCYFILCNMYYLYNK